MENAPAHPAHSAHPGPAAQRPEAKEGKEARELPDVREYGAPRDGARQVLDKRLYMQLLAFTDCLDPQALVEPLRQSGVEAVGYLDVNDPRGVAFLFPSEDAATFTDRVRPLLTRAPFAALRPRPELTMIGRTYSIGHEADLEDWILRKPRRNLAMADFPWHVWYPLRRKGEFERLSKEEQRPILMEHAKLGMAYGTAELAHDIRLACHGLDPHDNEFVLGLLARELISISRLVQDMRRTQQTSRYIKSMGPFFVGRVYCRVNAT